MHLDFCPTKLLIRQIVYVVGKNPFSDISSQGFTTGKGYEQLQGLMFDLFTLLEVPQSPDVQMRYHHIGAPATNAGKCQQTLLLPDP